MRLPFVVTVTVGAAAACGGAVTGENDSGNEGTEPGGTVAAGGAHAGGEAGRAVDVNAGGDDGTSWGTGGATTGGIVTGGTGGCNPPPCVQPYTTVCPAVEPAEGAPCNYDPSGQCPYGDCYGDFSGYAQCMGGFWDVSYGSCDPPATGECPLPLPQAGAPCDPLMDEECRRQYLEISCSAGWMYQETFAFCMPDALWVLETYSSRATCEVVEVNGDGGVDAALDATSD